MPPFQWDEIKSGKGQENLKIIGGGRRPLWACHIHPVLFSKSETVKGIYSATTIKAGLRSPPCQFPMALQNRYMDP